MREVLCCPPFNSLFEMQLLVHDLLSVHYQLSILYLRCRIRGRETWLGACEALSILYLRCELAPTKTPTVSKCGSFQFSI